MATKILLVNFEYIHGNRTFPGTVIFEGTTRMKEENIIDRYFKVFYGKGHFSKEDYIKASQYTYFDGEVAVQNIEPHEIDRETRDKLNELGIC